MKKIHTHTTLLLATLAALLLTGCKDRGIFSGNGTDLGDEIEVTFRYEVPDMEILSRSSVVSDSRLKYVEEIDVLVYLVESGGTERLHYHKPATRIDIQAGTFIVRLAKGNPGEKFTFDFLVNSSNQTMTFYSNSTLVNDVTTREEVIRNYTLNYTDGGPAVTPTVKLQMWAGISDPMEVTHSTSFPTLQLLSPFARIDVGTALVYDEEADKTYGQKLENFQLYYVGQVFGAQQARLIPDRANLDPSGVPTAPSLVSPYMQADTCQTGVSTFYDHYVESGLFINEPDVDFKDNSGWEQTLLIGGWYEDPDRNPNDGIGVHFYRIKLKDPDDPTKNLRFLRNHIYRVNILGITGPGVATKNNRPPTSPADLNAIPISENVVYELIVYEEGYINHLVYNNQYFLGVEKLILECTATDVTWGAYMQIKTNYPGGWSVASIKDEEGDNVNWLTVSPSSGAASSTSGAEMIQFIPKSVNNAEPRTALVTFAAGSLQIKVRVTQGGGWSIGTDYNGMQIKGDGDRFNVSMWGELPASVWVRANSYRNEHYETGQTAGWFAVSRDTIRVENGGSVNSWSPITNEMEILGNTWLTNDIRKVYFEYSLDQGATWIVFEQGLQGKGHYRLGLTGRIVALYDYGGCDDWAEAMGIDPVHNYSIANGYRYCDWWGASAWAEYNFTVLDNYKYSPDPSFPSGCGIYSEEGYEGIFPKGKWRLPAVGEMREMYHYADHIGDMGMDRWYWTSTEDSGNVNIYGNQIVGFNLRDGSYTGYIIKDGSGIESTMRVRCVFQEE